MPVLQDIIRASPGTVTPRTRQDAVAELGRHQNARAAAILVPLLEDEALGHVAARTFMKLQGSDVEKFAADRLTDPSPHTRGWMVKWLGANGGFALLPVLAQQARTETDTKVSQELIHAVNRMALRSGEPLHVQTFLAMLDDENLAPTARQLVYTLRDPRHAPLLHHFLQSPDAQLRSDIIRRLRTMKSPESVTPLMRVVTSEKDPARRRAAMEALVMCADLKRHGEVASFLAPFLDNDTSADAAAYALSRLRHPDAGTVMLRALTHQRPAVRGRMAQALGDMGYTPSADALARLASEDVEQSVRYQALKALGRVAATEAHLKVITAGLGQGGFGNASMEALAQLQNPAVTPHLFPLLKHPSQHVRRAVCRQLGSLAEPVSWVPLLDAVEGDESGPVKTECAEALALAGGPEALPRMLRLMETGNGMTTSALSKSWIAIDRTQRLTSLLELLGKKHPLARSLVNVLVSDPHPVDETVLQRLAVDKEPQVRRQGLLGLASMRTESAREALCRALARDPDAPARSTAAHGLEKFADSVAMECLVTALETVEKQRSPGLQESILRSLKSMTGQQLDDQPASWRAWLKAGQGGGEGGLVGALSSEDARVRTLAARSLIRQHLDLKNAVPVVMEQLPREVNGEARLAFIELLGRSGDVRAKDPLLAVLEGKRSMPERVALARALDSLGDGRGTLTLIEELDSSEPRTRTDAVTALSLITGEPPHTSAAWWKTWWKTYGERYRR